MKTLRVLSLLVLSAATAFAAETATGRLPRSTPEAQGISSTALLGFIATAEAKIQSLHSVMLVRHGQVVAEGWWAPYSAEERHQMFSLSKSFTSTAVGLAVAEGKLSVDDPVLGFFPEEAPAKPSATLRAMRVRDLLTMSTGHHNEDIQGFPYGSEESVVKKFLALPVTHKPGTFFVYNTPASYMLSAIVQKVTGQSVLAYLGPRLFAPLGIEGPVWEASRQGVSMGGFGLSIRTEDIASFGQLYLQKGQWQGKQLVPASWVATATSRWMSNGSAPTSDWEQGYGFQFWRCRFGVIRGDGAHGQFCVIFPEHDAVLAITAGTRDLQGVLNVVWETILPALQRGALPADAAAHGKLQAKLAALTLKLPAAVATPSQAAVIAGRRYVFPKNAQALEALTLAPSVRQPGATDVAVTIYGTEEKVTLDGRVWVRGELKSGPVTGPVALAGAWTADDTFTLEVVRYQTPFTMTHRLTFTGDKVKWESKPNVGAGAMTLVGKRE
ncbi:serine hydrolase domain-containing protein [Horticoccus sp. 23ND18S-11]|uniref:serine hydrolase domain-containing protein n=1 Tax=Horticoccus sp. 23ND18S-11 TaxID=3391832 RepID=UPI0039C96542